MWRRGLSESGFFLILDRAGTDQRTDHGTDSGTERLLYLKYHTIPFASDQKAGVPVEVGEHVVWGAALYGTSAHVTSRDFPLGRRCCLQLLCLKGTGRP